jgi:peptide/nickel transport system permease protein
MVQFVVRRTAAGLVVVVVASILVFLGLRAVPGDPASALAGETADPAALAAIRHHYLLDRPLPVQYGRWAWLALQGDLGRAESGLPVGQTIVDRLPLTIELAALSLLVAVALGVPAGVVAAARRARPSAFLASVLGSVGLCVPTFWLGILSILVFAVHLHWLPAGGYVTIHHPVANLRHLALPSLVLGAGFASPLMLQTRSSMLEALSSDYVTTARAKGLSEPAVISRHALRNSLITVTTLVGVEFGVLLSGAAVTESIFGIPGFGRLGLDAVLTRDYPLVQGIVLCAAVAYVAINVLVDIAYSKLDPRVGLSGGAA